MGFSAYGALVLCAAVGPGNSWVLALLCLGAACGIALFRLGMGFVANMPKRKELSERVPKALSVLRRLFWGALALTVAGLVCGRCALAWEKAAPFQELEGREFQVRAQLLDYPEERYHRYYYKLRVEAMGGEEESLSATQPFTLRLSASMPIAAQPYDWVECAVTFSAFDTGGLYSTLNSRLSDGIQAGGYLSQFEGVQVEENPVLSPGEMVARFRASVGRSLDRILPRRESGFLQALILGDGSGISEEDMANFRSLGVSHLLVVSGMHMTVLAGFLQLFLRRLPVRKSVANLFTALALLVYLILSGFQPSASRGAAMYGVLLLADSTGRRSDGLNSLGLAVLVVCLFHPFAGGDLGFALSVTATLGIVLMYRPLDALFSRWLWRPVAVSLAATVSALLGTFPVQLAVFGGFPLLLPLANFLMVIPGTALLYVAFLGAFLVPLPAAAPVAKLFLLAAGWLVRVLLWISQTLAQVKGAFLPVRTPGALLLLAGLLAVLVAALLNGDRLVRRVTACCGAVLAVGVILLSWGVGDPSAVLVAPATEGESCVVLIQSGKAAVLSLGGYRTSAVSEVLQRYNVREVTTVCLPVSTQEGREAAVQVLEEYGGSLTLPEGSYVGRDLELALDGEEVRFLEAGERFQPLSQVTAQVLPQWEGFQLEIYGVEVMVEWASSQGESCQVLFTNQLGTEVNSPLSVLQTDAIIGKNGLPAREGLAVPVEGGSLAVEISAQGTLSLRRED
ncbi:MAG: ComEC/Rec2 family competence protein [Acutalibacter sp.]|jgi:competence protein ComEC